MKKGFFLLFCFILTSFSFLLADESIIAIKNARILTVTQGMMDRGTLIIRGDQIHKVGEDLEIPQRARVIDASGCVVTPGLIDSHSHLGLGPSGGITEDNEMSDPCMPQLRIIDSIHPHGMPPHEGSFRDAVREGVTTVIARPGSGNVIGGQSAALKLTGDTVDEMILVFPVDMKMAMGRKNYYASKGKLPVTKMGTAYIVRKAMTEALNYRDRLQRKKKNNPDFTPERNLKYEALLKVLNREIPVHIHASPGNDIMTAVRLAEEFDFYKLSLAHAVESYRVADILAQKGVIVVVGPQMVTFDEEGKLINIADYLVKHGVEVNIMTDADVVQQEFLRFQASVAVKYGMNPSEALKAITINPARLIGMEERIGSLEKGKDADLVIFDGDPFDIQSEVRKVFINGKTVYKYTPSPENEGIQ
ncbi:amidohydrolase family protein [bacterium]|nr:amidohydrolase family protein [bacterium]